MLRKMMVLLAMVVALLLLIACQPDGSDVEVTPDPTPVSYTHLRAHETVLDLVCRLLLEKKKKNMQQRVRDTDAIIVHKDHIHSLASLQDVHLECTYSDIN